MAAHRCACSPIAATTTPMLVKRPVQSMWSAAAESALAATAATAPVAFVVPLTMLTFPELASSLDP